jgi:hypothetical protein
MKMVSWPSAERRGEVTEAAITFILLLVHLYDS